MPVTGTKGAMKLVAHRGDAKTLLAFDVAEGSARARLAGFTLRITPPGKPPYYLLNDLQFEHPHDHAQDGGDTNPLSSVNAPIHKFRWVHVPGSAHQGLDPAWGDYLYEATPRYFDAAGKMLPLDASLTASVTVAVGPFEKGAVKLGFTRGFTQSQAFVRHFGKGAKIKPDGADLVFDTGQPCGTAPGPNGQPFTYADQYRWSGFTARARIFEILDAVAADASLTLDMFAYDLNEPDVVKCLLQLGGEGRARIILDNADLHHLSDKQAAAAAAKGKPKTPPPEDEVEKRFAAAAGAGAMKRGKFGRFAHDKILIVREKQSGAAVRVLTGSTNFSITGMYVNSNHVLLFEDAAIAAQYAALFDAAWAGDVKEAAFVASPLASNVFSFGGGGTALPDIRITFSPHDEAHARDYLTLMTDRVEAERTAENASVMFAVMELDGGKDNPVYDALSKLHEDQTIFSCGVSDDPKKISLYPVGETSGVLVTGKPVGVVLPPPFDQVRSVGMGHQIHHKFVICGFNRPDAAMWCGSSNLALLGEQVNGDNLIAIRDCDIATAFAIEGLALVDHFNFLDAMAKGPKAPKESGKAGEAGDDVPPPADKAAGAVAAGWFLSTDDGWSKKYFDPKDLHCRDRALFAG
jgi:hypothetical protein